MLAKSTLSVNNCGLTNSHADYLRNIARVNGLTLYDTITGGECFYDAVSRSLREIGINRSIADLRTITASQLELQANVFRPLYFVVHEEDQQDQQDQQMHRQAATFDLFVERTRHGKEWATDMCYPALALGLDMTLRVVATTIANDDGNITAHYLDYNEGVQVTDAASVVVVGCNTAEGHYIGFGTMPLFVIERPVNDENNVAVLASDNSQSVCSAKKRKTFNCEFDGCCYADNNRNKFRMHQLAKHKVVQAKHVKESDVLEGGHAAAAGSLFKKPDAQNKERCHHCQKYFVNLENHKVCRSKNICHQSALSNPVNEIISRYDIDTTSVFPTDHQSSSSQSLTEAMRSRSDQRRSDRIRQRSNSSNSSSSSNQMGTKRQKTFKSWKKYTSKTTEKKRKTAEIISS